MSEGKGGALVPVGPEGPAAPPRPEPPAERPPAPSAKEGLRARLTQRRERMSTSRAALLSMTSQEAPIAQKEGEGDLLWVIQAFAMRAVGLLWFVATLVVWGRLVGVFDGGVSGDWHAPAGPWLGSLIAALVVPVVSVGLWLTASWGAVVWTAVVLVALIGFVAAPGAMPVGAIWLLPNVLGIVAVGGIAGFRAWRDRDFDD
ncbi:MAG: hypothetical protein AAF318_19285 [Pseudomonadota bacterium]